MSLVSTEIQRMLPQMRSYFASQPINRAWLFGSCSRGEETVDSDIDILVAYDQNARISLFTISRITQGIKQILNRPVDLVEDGCLLPFAADSVLQDRILIYEREN